MVKSYDISFVSAHVILEAEPPFSVMFMLEIYIQLFMKDLSYGSFNLQQSIFSTILSECIEDKTCADADATKPVCNIDGGNICVGTYFYQRNHP